VSRERRITKGKTIGVALVTAIVSISIPASAAAEGDVVDDLLKGVNDVVGGATGGGDGGGPAANDRDAPSDRAGSPPNYTPPLHGSNPHGQGTPAVVDLAPSNNLPLGGNPDGSDAGPEEVVLGRTRGEQDAAGNYNGHITILALLGTELVGVDSDEGETVNGPLAGLQAGLLDPDLHRFRWAAMRHAVAGRFGHDRHRLDQLVRGRRRDCRRHLGRRGLLQRQHLGVR